MKNKVQDVTLSIYLYLYVNQTIYYMFNEVSNAKLFIYFFGTAVVVICFVVFLFLNKKRGITYKFGWLPKDERETEIMKSKFAEYYYVIILQIFFMIMLSLFIVNYLTNYIDFNSGYIMALICLHVFLIPNVILVYKINKEIRA